MLLCSTASAESARQHVHVNLYIYIYIYGPILGVPFVKCSQWVPKLKVPTVAAHHEVEIALKYRCTLSLCVWHRVWMSIHSNLRDHPGRPHQSWYYQRLLLPIALSCCTPQQQKVKLLSKGSVVSCLSPPRLERSVCLCESCQFPLGGKIKYHFTIMTFN